MIRFERTHDYDLIRGIMTNPRLYRWIGDDFAPSREEFRPVEDERLWYVLAYAGDELLGLFVCLPQSTVLWEVHVCLLPVAWGRSAAVLLQLTRWLFAHTPAQRLVGAVPACNRLMLACAKQAGFEQFAVNQKAFMRNGQLHDLVLFGVSKNG